MKIEIRYCYDDKRYYWELYDGPDGIDNATGSVYTLGEAFEEIIKQRLLISKGLENN